MSPMTAFWIGVGVGVLLAGIVGAWFLSRLEMNMRGMNL